MNIIPSIVVPIITDKKITNENLFNLFRDKFIIVFGVPGAFTPTCSEEHLPGFIDLNQQIKKKGIEDIYCLSVNDAYVMKSWLRGFDNGTKIKGIADGNADVAKSLNLIIDKSSSFMGLRCLRFAMIVKNNIILKLFIDDPAKFEISSAENILQNI